MKPWFIFTTNYIMDTCTGYSCFIGLDPWPGRESTCCQALGEDQRQHHSLTWLSSAILHTKSTQKLKEWLIGQSTDNMIDLHNSMCAIVVMWPWRLHVQSLPSQVHYQVADIPPLVVLRISQLSWPAPPPSLPPPPPYAPPGSFIPSSLSEVLGLLESACWGNWT